MEKNEYQPYDKRELYSLLNEPWEVSDQPYKLHAAYALSSLYDLVVPESEDGDEPKPLPEDIWGMTVPKKMLDRLAVDIENDFNDAARNYKRIKVWGRTYAIRKLNAFDPTRLHLIFNFPLEGEEYKIVPEGVMYLVAPTPEILDPYKVSSDEAKENRTFVRKVIMLAEDDEHNGWDKLTDMELIVYLWAQFYNKHQCNNLLQFKKAYKDYIYVTDEDLKFCYNAKSKLSERPEGMYAFSARSALEWNKQQGQKSYVNDISAQDAEDYWYDVALKKSFKPIDQQ